MLPPAGCTSDKQLSRGVPSSPCPAPPASTCIRRSRSSLSLSSIVLSSHVSPREGRFTSRGRTGGTPRERTTLCSASTTSSPWESWWANWRCHYRDYRSCGLARPKKRNNWPTELPNIANSVFLFIEFTLNFLIINFNKMRGCAGCMQNNGKRPFL